MAILPYTKNLTATQGATFLYVVRRVQNKQTITLTGTGTGPWYISLYRTKTVAISRTAPPSEVQAALQALPRVGTSGVTVSGTAGSTYTLDWGGPLGSVEVERVEIIVPANVTATVDYVPFDWTGWTGVFRVRNIDADADPVGTKVLEINETPSSDGQVIFGYEYPTSPGGADGTPIPTNGRLAVKIPPAKTISLFSAIHGGGHGADYVLLVQSPSGFVQALMDGLFAVKEEPLT